MEKTLPTLRVQLFGRGEITYDNRPILSGRGSVTKVMKLWLILLYYGEEGIAKNKLLEALYGWEEVLDESNSLRVNIYRLKRLLLKEGLPEYDYIVVEKGVYYWRSPMITEVDSAYFEEYIRQADEAENKAGRIELLKKACEIAGKGDFLQNLSGEEWVIMESARYRNLYGDALQEVCDYLIEKKEYEEALKMVEPACELYPLDEWQTVRMECYMGMDRYKDALREYDETAELLYEELGIEPSERMQELLAHMNKHMENKPQVISEIKNNLHEEEKTEGAFYCCFPSFRDEFRLVQRMMERSGQSNYLMLVSITDGKGYRLTSEKKLSEMSQTLQNVIYRCLRRCDSYTKYNASQFLILLLGTNKENCKVIFNRITQEFSREHKSWIHNLEGSVSSVADTEI